MINKNNIDEEIENVFMQNNVTPNLNILNLCIKSDLKYKKSTLLCLKGYILLRIDPKEAKVCFDRAIESDDGALLAHEGLGIYYSMISDFHAALKCQEEILKLCPSNFQALHNKAVYLKHFKRYEEAEEIADLLLNIFNECHLSYEMKGSILFRTKRIKEAMNYFTQALEIDPYSNESLRYTAWDYYKRGKLQDAKDALKKINASSQFYADFVNLFRKKIELKQELMKKEKFNID
jgi:tetratricopeptide (TPR) repeat protein